MKLLTKSKITVDRSKFFGYLFEANSELDIKTILKTVSKEHKKISHLCYGAIVGDKTFFKNDAEVGNPGKVLLNILESNNQINKILIVVRIFGGVQLGVSGVSKAFRDCGKECVA